MKVLLLILFIIYSITVYAQPVGSADSTIHSCNYKSTNILFTDIGIDTIYYGNGVTTNYKDAQYKYFCTPPDLVKHCIQSENTALYYYVYYPKKHNYTAMPLPCMIVEHGGSYSDCSGIPGTANTKSLCIEYAKRGWVAVDLEYRRAILKTQQLYLQPLQIILFVIHLFIRLKQFIKAARIQEAAIIL